MQKDLIITKLDIPLLLEKSLQLKQKDRLAISQDGLLYLDITDDFIHDLFPLLENKYQEIVKPDYFTGNSIGAHISVVYPDEKYLTSPILTEEHHFQVIDAVSTIINLKRYYVLIVNAASLSELRKKYSLSDQPKFKGYVINFHITLGVETLDAIKENV